MRRPVERSLFDFASEERQNQYERAVALVLDRHANILWWYRNIVGAEHFAIQGYRKNLIRPDFVVQSGARARPVHQVLVIESRAGTSKRARHGIQTDRRRVFRPCWQAGHLATARRGFREPRFPVPDTRRSPGLPRLEGRASRSAFARRVVYIHTLTECIHKARPAGRHRPAGGMEGRVTGSDAVA